MVSKVGRVYPPWEFLITSLPNTFQPGANAAYSDLFSRLFELCYFFNYSSYFISLFSSKSSNLIASFNSGLFAKN